MFPLIMRNCFLSICMYMWMQVCMLSYFSCIWLFATLWTVAFQVPLSVRFLRQEYWSGLPRCPPRDLLDPGIKFKFLALSPALQADSLPLSHQEACIDAYDYTNTHTHICICNSITKCTRRVYTGRIHTKFIKVVSSEDTGRVIGLDWSWGGRVKGTWILYVIFYFLYIEIKNLSKC